MAGRRRVGNQHVEVADVERRSVLGALGRADAHLPQLVPQVRLLVTEPGHHQNAAARDLVPCAQAEAA